MREPSTNEAYMCPAVATRKRVARAPPPSPAPGQRRWRWMQGGDFSAEWRRNNGWRHSARCKRCQYSSRWRHSGATRLLRAVALVVSQVWCAHKVAASVTRERVAVALTRRRSARGALVERVAALGAGHPRAADAGTRLRVGREAHARPRAYAHGGLVLLPPIIG